MAKKTFWDFALTSGLSTGIGKKKGGGGGGSTYQFQPYSGARPTAPSFTKPSEEAIFKRLMEQMQGINVGYDPARKQAGIDLLKSQIDKRKEDDMRDAQGRISSSGVSGNARAVEAIAGRVGRDASRTFGEGVTGLTIEDLAAANQERLAGTNNLQRFNEFQFGQGNKVADFDLNVYGQEQGLQRGASQDALAQRNFETSRSDDQFGDLLGLGLAGADLLATSQGVPPGTVSSIGALANRQSGTGIGQTPITGQREYIGSRSGVRKNLTR